MPEEHETASAPGRQGPLGWLREGVVPEVLGLCFVAVVFAGLTAGYVVSDYWCARQASAARQVRMEDRAAAYAVLVGAVAEREPEARDAVLRQIGQAEGVVGVRWKDAEGTLAYVFPPSSAAGARGGAWGTPTRVPVVAPDGTPQGELTVAYGPLAEISRRGALFWGWGSRAS
jgi:hypothetical protein